MRIGASDHYFFASKKYIGTYASANYSRESYTGIGGDGRVTFTRTVIRDAVKVVQRPAPDVSKIYVCNGKYFTKKTFKGEYK